MGYIAAKMKALKKAARGKTLGGDSDSREARLLSECKQRFENNPDLKNLIF